MGSSSSCICGDDQDDDQFNENLQLFISSFGFKYNYYTIEVMFDSNIRVLDPTSDAAQVIKLYFHNSCSPQSDQKIVRIWSVNNKNQLLKFNRVKDLCMLQMLVWHGTRRDNLVNILLNQFKFPREYIDLYGPGIYFSDRVAQCNDYTDRRGAKVYLLCQVAHGKMLEVIETKNIRELPESCQSLKLVGRYRPDISGHKYFDRCVVPCGRTERHPEHYVQYNCGSDYNQYVIHEPQRVLIRFIVHCETVQLNANSLSIDGKE